MHAAAAAAWLAKVSRAWRGIALLRLTAQLFPQNDLVVDNDIFDFIIVGGGTSGCVIANRLTENKDFKVLLIEAGGDPPLESVEYHSPLFMKNTDVDWKYKAEYDKKLEQCHQSPNLEISIGKMLGGTSSLNYGFYSRGTHVDYDNWAAVCKNSTWSAKEVLSYFIKSERLKDSAIENSPYRKYHGFSGEMGVRTTRDKNEGRAYDYMEGIKQAGIDIRLDLNGNDSMGHAASMIMLADGYRQSTAYSFIRPIKDRPNLYVLKNTLVTKILFDKNKNAVGVEAMKKCNVSMCLKAKKEVIVTAGPFNTPKLLMLSGIGPKKELKNKGIEVVVNLPVGKNLQDHPANMVYIKLNKVKGIPPVKNRLHSFIAATYWRHAFNKSQTYPDFGGQSFYYESAYNNLQYCATGQRFKNELCDNIYEQTKCSNVLANVIINFHTKYRGEVLLRSTDPNDPPIINYKYLSNKVDRENLAKYTTYFLKVLDTPYFKKFGAELVDVVPGCNHFNRGSKEYYECYVSCMMSPRRNFGGTCAMGSVVDDRLHVYKVKGLRLADASIMPTIPRAQVTASTIMIGEKAADFIKEDYE